MINSKSSEKTGIIECTRNGWKSCMKCQKSFYVCNSPNQCSNCGVRDDMGNIVSCIYCEKETSTPTVPILLDKEYIVVIDEELK